MKQIEIDASEKYKRFGKENKSLLQECQTTQNYTLQQKIVPQTEKI